MSEPRQALHCERLSDDLAGLAWRPLPAPARPLAAHEVRLRVLRCALNFPDLLMTQGLYHLRPELPFVPGMEGVGEVLEAGDAARAAGHVPGALRVFTAKQGGLASEWTGPASALQPMPAGLTLDEAAAFFVTGLTAWVALARIGRLQRGETLLVHGARGGVGQACVQLGRQLGARVIATASDPARLALLLPRDVTCLAVDAGLDQAVLAATDGRGADVVADPVGGEVFEASLRCAAYGARLLVLGFASGHLPQLKLQRVLNRGLAVLGVRAGEYGRRHPQQADEHAAAVLHLAASGVLRPAVGAVFPFHQAVEALRAMQRRQVTGKIVVHVADA